MPQKNLTHLKMDKAKMLHATKKRAYENNQQ